MQVFPAVLTEIIRQYMVPKPRFLNLRYEVAIRDLSSYFHLQQFVDSRYLPTLPALHEERVWIPDVHTIIARLNLWEPIFYKKGFQV